MSEYAQPQSSLLVDFEPVPSLSVKESADRRWPIPRCFKGAFTTLKKFTLQVDSLDNELSIVLNGQLITFLANPSFGGYPSTYGPIDLFANLEKGKNVLVLSLVNYWANGSDRNPSSIGMRIYVDGAFKQFNFSSSDHGSAEDLRQGLIAQVLIEITKA